jgi:exopolysaccharide biosynthesis polyprenyl glycosylphosphotransferase
MTMTTEVAAGVAPVVRAAGSAGTIIDASSVAGTALRPAISRPPARARRRVALWPLDLLVGAAVALGGWALLPAWPLSSYAVVVLAWPLAVVGAGGGSSAAATPWLRPLLSAACALAAAAWAAVAVVPDGVGGASSHELAAATLVLTGGLVVGSAAVRGIAGLSGARSSTRVVLVGARSDITALVREAGRDRRRRFDPVAACATDYSDDLNADEAGGESRPVPVCGDVAANLLDLVDRHDADGVVVATGPGVGPVELRRWASWLQDRDVPLLVSSGLHDVAPTRLATTSIGGARLLRVAPAPLHGPARVVKDLCDRLVALILLVALGPLLLGLLALIRFDSPGPALYRQTRVGRRGRLFTVYKLRTMVRDADRLRATLADANDSDRAGALFKMRRDPRVTRIGTFLRRYSLDELPQLLNVLKGDMSLVGPRPALPAEVETYAPDVCRRLAVRPGITGLWQVSGRSELSWEETVRLDLQYVDNWSWWLDLHILLRTTSAVVGHKGAY